MLKYNKASSWFVCFSYLQQQYTLYLCLSTALHVSGGISTHHQELITLYLQYLALMWPVLLPVVNVQPRSRQVAVTVTLMPDTVDTMLWAPDNGWKYHPKHVEQLTDMNKLYTVASCRIIIATNYPRCVVSLAGVYGLECNSSSFI